MMYVKNSHLLTGLLSFNTIDTLAWIPKGARVLIAWVTLASAQWWPRTACCSRQIKVFLDIPRVT